MYKYKVENIFNFNSLKHVEKRIPKYKGSQIFINLPSNGYCYENLSFLNT